MKTLCIIPCGSRKIWDKNPDAGPVEAKYVYTGRFSKKCREYAEKFYPNDWCILSAKHGFLYPNDIIPEPYNVTFKIKRTRPISSNELSKQIVDKSLDKYEKIVIIGGKDYVNIAKKCFPSKEVYTPLSGCKGNGEMESKLNGSLRTNISL